MHAQVEEERQREDAPVAPLRHAAGDSIDTHADLSGADGFDRWKAAKSPRHDRHDGDYDEDCLGAQRQSQRTRGLRMLRLRLATCQARA